VRDKVINEHASGQTGAVIRQTRQNKSLGGDESYVWHSMRSARGNVRIPLTKTLATNCGIAFGSRNGRWQISSRQQSINSVLYTDYGVMLTNYHFTLPKPEYTPYLSFLPPYATTVSHTKEYDDGGITPRLNLRTIWLASRPDRFISRKRTPSNKIKLKFTL